MFHIILQRQKEYKNIQKPPKAGKVYKEEDSTIGSFKVFDDENKEVFSCFCVENIGPSTDTPRQDKRIIPRVYKLYWTQSSVSLPKEYAPRVLSLYTDELPSFKERRIHIHIGNYPQDTEGCLLLNYADNGNGTGGRSTDAVRDFYALVEKAGVENFTLEVKEIIG
ncbi:DUF5675 family protein [Helicobacter himalayensis]|uniref:DUF5675 family protein n=1 Tax=Helicobacter himalayensis TaxID=1591088 RepID=UPI000835B1C1|nr:DUF5675 family protein [Helicobacter himalayensis]